MTFPRLEGVAYHLPAQVLTNGNLANDFADWTAEKIQSKTGINERRISGAGEFVSDLAVAAGEAVLERSGLTPADIDFVLLCTQSPDYYLPTTACLVQDRLGIPTTAGALDFNLGCSGYIYGLGLATGLLATGQARRVLLLTSETYSKHIHQGDRSVRTLFGDAAAATILGDGGTRPGIGPFVYGTDGAGGENLIVRTGGMRARYDAAAEDVTDDSGNVRSANNLYMNGGEIFNFTLRSVPDTVSRLLDKSGLAMDDVDHFVFHQANAYMLEHLRRKLKIEPSRFVVSMAHCGNTVSSTIPIALRDAADEGRFKPGDRLMLVGFGVGYSWGATLLTWPGSL